VVAKKSKKKEKSKKEFYFSCRIYTIRDLGGLAMMSHEMDKTEQKRLELVMLEQMVKENHLLRKIDKYVDFKFIYDLVKDLYSQNNGRPSVDPVVLIKMLFIQYLYGITSERRLIDEVHHNMAYRWFLGFGITTKIPHHSIFSQNKIRRFKDSRLFEEIFYKILEQADEYGLIKGKIIYTDSTHIRAYASNSKYTSEEVVTEVDGNKDLDRINNIRMRHGHKPLKVKEDKVKTKQKKVSKTDPDSGYMNRDRKPEGFYFLDHRTVDSSYNIILDTFITAGNVHDATPYLDRIDHITEVVKGLKNAVDIKYTCADAGYFNNKVFKGLKERHLSPIIGAIRHQKKPGKDSKYWFTYDIIEDVYVCRMGQLLEYKRTSRDGYSQYESEAEICNECEHKLQCIFDKADKRTIRRHVFEEYKEEAREILKTDKGKALYDRRKETVERSFADSKTHHGYRYAHYRGQENVQDQAYLVATVQNIKKMAMVLDSMGVK